MTTATATQTAAAAADRLEQAARILLDADFTSNKGSCYLWDAKEAAQAAGQTARADALKAEFYELAGRVNGYYAAANLRLEQAAAIAAA